MNPGDLVAYGPLLLAIPVAMAAGLVSFLSPCCLPLLPGYLAYVTGTAGADAASGKPQPLGRSTGEAGTATAVATRPARPRRPSRTVVGTLLFVLGFAAVFTSYGAAFGAAGTLLLRHQDLIIKVLGVFTIVLGLMFTGALSRIPLFVRTFRLNFQPRLGVASSPCWACSSASDGRPVSDRRWPPFSPCRSVPAAPGGERCCPSPTVLASGFPSYWLR